MTMFLLSKKTLIKKAIDFIFPSDKKILPEEHANAILITISQFETDAQSNIIAKLKEAMIKDREDTIAELTADLEKLKKI